MNTPGRKVPVDQEPGPARSARLDLEKRALQSRADDSLRSRLQRIIAAGGYFEDDNDDQTIERALLGYAAVVTKAVAVALVGADVVTCSGHGVDVEFSKDEAARALCGLSALLAEAEPLCYSIQVADDGATAEAAE